jgi:hypothetical protein
LKVASTDLGVGCTLSEAETELVEGGRTGIAGAQDDPGVLGHRLDLLLGEDGLLTDLAWLREHGRWRSSIGRRRYAGVPTPVRRLSAALRILR